MQAYSNPKRASDKSMSFYLLRRFATLASVVREYAATHPECVTIDAGIGVHFDERYPETAREIGAILRTANGEIHSIFAVEV
jgi:hypothetical protein